MRASAVICAVALAGYAAGLHAQSKRGAGPAKPVPSALAAAIDAEISNLEGQVVPLAEAMPEERYSFSPESLNIPGSVMKGVRTYALQVRHLAADNFAIWAPLTGKPEPAGIKAPAGPADMTGRTEILKFLKDSFVYAHRAAANLTIANELDMVTFRGQSVTRLSLVALALTHAMDHYGQMVEYVRMVGVVPPGSQMKMSAP
ncbi:MAG: DinB family protein [Gemmatimonadales bacterium]